jgi:hypothetical protein
MPDRDSKDQRRSSTIAGAEDLVTRIEADLRPVIRAIDLGGPSLLPFKVASLRQTLVLRILDLARSSMSLCRAGLNVGAAILARALMETTSQLFRLEDLIRRATGSADLDELDDRIMTMLFGSRNRSTRREAVNILTQIDAMDRMFTGLRTWYDDLSELAHPNFAGLLASYARVEREPSAWIAGGPPEKSRSLAQRVVIPALCACLEISLSYQTKLTALEPAFAEACHHRAGDGLGPGR